MLLCISGRGCHGLLVRINTAAKKACTSGASEQELCFKAVWASWQASGLNRQAGSPRNLLVFCFSLVLQLDFYVLQPHKRTWQLLTWCRAVWVSDPLSRLQYLAGFRELGSLPLAGFRLVAGAVAFTLFLGVSLHGLVPQKRCEQALWWLLCIWETETETST